MTAADAIALLLGPRREEIQELLDEFFDGWGNTLAYHPRVMQFGAFALWLEQRGLAHLSGGPERKVGVAGRKNENGGRAGGNHA